MSRLTASNILVAHAEQQRIPAEFVKQAHRTSETQLAQVERLKMELLQEQDEGARAYEAMLRHAEKVITAEGPTAPLSRLAERLYSSSKRAKDQKLPLVA